MSSIFKINEMQSSHYRIGLKNAKLAKAEYL